MARTAEPISQARVNARLIKNVKSSPKVRKKSRGGEGADNATPDSNLDRIIKFPGSTRPETVRSRDRNGKDRRPPTQVQIVSIKNYQMTNQL